VWIAEVGNRLVIGTHPRPIKLARALTRPNSPVHRRAG
jgi:hypothetical protein